MGISFNTIYNNHPMFNLTVIVATFNEEKNIQKCLLSIESIADEIIVVDGKSTDKTVEIAKKFTNKIYSVDNVPMFHSNKQYGLDKSRGDWILQLDADEIMSEALKNEITKILSQGQDTFDGYYIPRRNNFLGHFMIKGGLYPDYVIRLFKRGSGLFPQKSVHEQISINGKVDYLKNPLFHYPYNTVNDYLIKANRYTTLTSLELKEKKIKVNFFNTIKYCVLIPFSTFFAIYFRHLGFKDGFYGFVWAYLSSTHYFFAYSKLLNGNKKK